MEIPEHEILMSRATEEDVKSVISTVQRWVLKVVPDAKLMYGTDKRGDVINVAIYDCKLVLDSKGHINVKASNSPQRISDLFEYREEWNKSRRSNLGVLKLVANVWSDAMLNQIKLGNVKWHKVKREWLTS